MGLLDKAIEYVGWPHLYEATNQHQFDVLMEQGLKSRHDLLDVGCGCLGVGSMLIEYLDEMNYWGVDPEAWLIQASGIDKRLFHFHAFSDFKITRLKKKFNFILAHSIFTHADRAMIQTLLAEAKASLKKRGVFLASFYDQRFGDSDHVGWLHPAGVSYMAESIQREAEKAGFKAEIIKDPRHPANHTWLVAR